MTTATPTAEHLRQTANSQDPKMQEWIKGAARTIMYEAKIPRTPEKS